MSELRPSANNRKRVSNATINIQNLRLRTFIGFNPEEKEKKQDIVLNISITYSITEAALNDHVEEALDYKVITKQVIKHVESGRFLLLEKLVADVLDICSSHPDVRASRVTIDKPHALRFADSVSLTLQYHADENSNLRYLEKAS